MSEQEGECHHCNEPQADGYCWWCGKRQQPLNDSRIHVAAREGLAALVAEWREKARFYGAAYGAKEHDTYIACADALAAWLAQEPGEQK